MSQSSNSFERKILGYEKSDAKKPLIKSTVFEKSTLASISRAWQTIDSIFDNNQKSNKYVLGQYDEFGIKKRAFFYLRKKFIDC